MTTLSKKTKIAIAAITALALILLIAIPFAGAQTPLTGSSTNTKTVQAKGYSFQKIDSSTIKYYPANLTLILQPMASNNATVKKFDVTGGKIFVNGVSYSISSGVGGVLPGRHLILLKAQGVGPDGQPVTLGLEGQYFWMWGNQYAVRIAARLQTDTGNVTFLMRAAI